MKITRLRIEQLRKFRDPLQIDDFEAGLNLFSGPNESGKSSIVRAIRAAFFERYRSMRVDDLRPLGDSAAAPSVDIDFDINDTHYRLSKRFLLQKRCDLIIGDERLSGVEAEDRLAELFGFRFAAKGASKPEHWGVPGLLWIDQGDGHELNDFVDNAIDKLRGALNSSLSELTSSDGDQVLDAVIKRRAELLTATGKPTGEMARLEAALLENRETLSELKGNILEYRETVDQIERLRQDHADENLSKPWLAIERNLDDARQRLAGVEQLEQGLRDLRERLVHIGGTIDLLREGIERHAQRGTEQSTRAANLDAVNESLRSAEAGYRFSIDRLVATKTAHDQAQRSAVQARQAQQRLTLDRRVADCGARITAIKASLAPATEAFNQLQALRTAVAEQSVDDEQLGQLREQDKRLRELQLRQSAVATRLDIELHEGRHIQIDGESVSGSSERELTTALNIDIPDLGRIRIQPGGRDLATLAQQESALLAEHRRLLLQNRVDTLGELESRATAFQETLSAQREAQLKFKAHAPQGLDHLKADLDAYTTELATAQTTLSELPAAEPVVAKVLPIEEIEAEVSLAATTLSSAQDDVARAQEALTIAKVNVANAERESKAISEIINHPDQIAKRRQADAQLAATRTQQGALQAEIRAAEKALADAAVPSLRQDIERLQSSAQQAHQRFGERTISISKLVGRLEAGGAEGLEESANALEAQIGQQEDRHAEMTQRASALTLLQELITARRQALTSRLQAPLAARLQHYLSLLFANAQLSLDEQLRPAQLRRGGSGNAGNGSGDSTREPIDQISFGAREQMGVISRLAYADLLREAGHPTLIILDDALVHSDRLRLDRMKRVLYDAGTRHQILMFTCHPEQWQDLGVPARSIESLSQ